MGKQKAPTADEQVAVLRVILSDGQGHIRGRPCRLLALPENWSLYELAEAIVTAFDFEFDHAFGFYDHPKRWTDSQECYELFTDLAQEEGEALWERSRCGSVRKTSIGEVFDRPKKRMLFLFDYGDEWHFLADLRGREPWDPGARYPRVLRAVGKVPEQYRS